MRSLSALIVLLAATQVGATDCGQITRDQGFDLWCGDVLCTWKLERGDIKQVGTWNEHDSGVEMIGPDVALEQLTPVTSGDTTCIRFDLVANVEETAQVELHADVFGDGSVEFSERLPTAHWKPLSFIIPVRAPYNGVRFELTKRGAGRAVLAQLQAEVATAAECDGLAPIVPDPAPPGGECTTDDQCASGLCRVIPLPGTLFGFGRVCVGCDPAGGAACTGTEVCGAAEPGSRVLFPSTTCVAPASHLLGERCIAATECATGVCTSGVCSTCGASAGVCTQDTCQPAYPEGPSECGPNQHRGDPGAVCATHDDCASGSCRGTERKQCSDGRACTTPEQCPVEAGLAPGACEPVGIEGGRCD